MAHFLDSISEISNAVQLAVQAVIFFLIKQCLMFLPSPIQSQHCLFASDNVQAFCQPCGMWILARTQHTKVAPPLCIPIYIHTGATVKHASCAFTNFHRLHTYTHSCYARCLYEKIYTHLHTYHQKSRQKIRSAFLNFWSCLVASVNVDSAFIHPK